MAKLLDFKLSGAGAMQDILQSLTFAPNKSVLTKILLKNGKPIAEDAASRVRHRSGALARNARVGTQLSPRQAAMHKKLGPGVEVFIGFGPIPYAHMQEFGTIHHAAHPALRPAWEHGKGMMWSGIKRDLWRHLYNMAKRRSTND